MGSVRCLSHAALAFTGDNRGVEKDLETFEQSSSIKCGRTKGETTDAGTGSDRRPDYIHGSSGTIELKLVLGTSPETFQTHSKDCYSFRRQYLQKSAKNAH